MNCIQRLDIRLSREHFYPGETVEGQLVVDVLEAFHLQRVHLLLRGKAHCEWKVYVSGDRRTLKDDQYFVDSRSIIWESGRGQEEEQEAPEEDQKETPQSLLAAGRHQFPFSCSLPLQDLPCSLESRACSIRYHLRALLDVLDTGEENGREEPLEVPQGVKYFSVVGPLVDCNENKYLNPLFGSEKRWRFCLCCRKQVASLRCILDRNAFCSGETIRLKTFVQNHSTETVKLKVRLVQFCEFNAQKANLCGVTKEVQHLVLEYTSDEMSPDEEFALTTSHCLPVLPPSIVGLSRLIQLYYTMTVCLEFERSGQDLQMLFPIRIATQPYTGAGTDFHLEYAPCCDHVEGGIYLDPEFASRGSGFWDDDQDGEEGAQKGSVEAVPLYRPVYLKVVRNTPGKGEQQKTEE